MNYKEVRLEEVLKWQPQIEIDPLTIKELSIDDEPKYPFYGQATNHNGIIGYYNLHPSVLNNKEGLPTILIHSNNHNIVYLETPFYLKDGHGATSVLQSSFLNVKSALYIMTSIRKAIETRFTYNAKATKIALKNTKIVLPIGKDGKVDYAYMENYVSSLEKDGLVTIENYLKNNLLEDFDLTDKEKEVLESFKTLKFHEYNIADLFTIKNAGSILSRSIIENSGETPYLCASAENNAVSSYISYNEKYLDEGNCIFIGGKTFVVTYQESDFYSNDSHNLVLYLMDKEKRNKLIQLYLVTCINNSLKHKYSWGDSVSKAKIQNDKILLPTKNNKPDYDFIEMYMKAMEKIVLRDVINWKNNILKTE